MHCAACGMAYEGDAPEADPPLRAELLRREGEWRAVLTAVDDRTRTALALLEVGISRRDAIRMAKTPPTTIYRGTRAEAEALVAVLTARGVKVQVEAPSPS